MIRIFRVCMPYGICAAMILTPVAARATATTATTVITGGTTSYLNHLPPTPEIHVIGIYEPAAASPIVRVKYNESGMMKPITLVLSSYEAASWTIQADPGVRIASIVLNGYESQSVKGISGVPVVNRSGFQQSFHEYAHRWPQSTGGSSTQEMLIGIENSLGARVSSFTGAYYGQSFTLTGHSTTTIIENPLLGAGNLADGPNPDLLYYPATGEVKLDLSDLAAQYPFGGGAIWWQHFTAQRLFIALANHDGTFDATAFDPSDLRRVGIFGDSSAVNSNRLGVDGVLLRNWRGELMSLGNILPQGITNVQSLRQYFAAADFATDRENGGLDLIVMPVPEPSMLTMMFTLGGFALAAARRRRGLRRLHVAAFP